jgi:hypothetical protein
MKKINTSNKNIFIDSHANINPVIKLNKIKGRKCQNKTVNHKITFDDLVNCNELEYDFDELYGVSKLTKDQYIAYRKYMLLNKIGICDYKNADDFKLLAEKFFNKEQYIDRYEKLFGLINQEITSDEKMSINIVKDFISIIFGSNKFTANDILDVHISNKKYLKIIKNFKEKSIYFTNEEKHHSLFFKSKKIGPQSDDDRRYIAIIKQIMKMYGIIFQTNDRIRKNHKRKYTYLVTTDPLLYKLMCNKHELNNKKN